jgi:serine/threonine-protein kinase
LGEHQHLNKVVDFGLDGDEYFAVFEFIEGTRLDQLIDSPVKRPEKQIVLWGMQILSAEQHMYNKGFIFRDLKPQNIMIDKNGNAKLFDFGLAMSIDEALNNTSNQIQGSPYYLPPERIVGTGESQHSEIYSLGMVMFHVLAKTPYYSADDIKTLVSKHVVSLRVNQVKSKLPHKTNPKLVEVIEKMIARLPENRYATYKEVAGELFKIYNAA